MNFTLHAGLDETLVFSGIQDADGETIPQAELAAMTHTLRVSPMGAATSLEATGTATGEGEVTFSLTDTQTTALGAGVFPYQYHADNAGDGDVVESGLLVLTTALSTPSA